MKYTERDHAYALKKANRIRGINILGGKCNLCNENDIHLLEFHHNDRNKEKSISQILNRRWSVLILEIKKCKLLCANCHAEYHCFNMGKRSKIKTKILKILGISKCSSCGYEGKNFASLDFHHINSKNKSFCVSKNIKELKIKEILDESKKCKIICKNCHKKTHNDFSRFNKLKLLIEYKIKHPNEKPSEYDKNKIWKLYEEGKSIGCICEMMGCKNGTITYIIQQLRTKNGMTFKDHRSGRKWKIK